MLSDKQITQNIAVKQSQNAADVHIIETAIEQFNATNTIVVVGEDVNLLIRLTARTPIDKIIYFQKPGRAIHSRCSCLLLRLRNTSSMSAQSITALETDFGNVHL